MPQAVDLLAQGFAKALSPENLFYAFAGSLIGTLVGVLPGIGPTAGLAILMPLTAVLSPSAAIIMMAAVYYGAMYGGSTTAIVVNIPGEAASVPTALDGYQLARQGRAGAALGMAAIASFVAGTLGLVGLTFFTPPLARVALRFGPPEYFALVVLSLSLVVSLSGSSLPKGLASACLGLLAGTIGLDPISGTARLTFGSQALTAGLHFVAIVIGLFAFSEVFINVERSAAYLYETKLIGWLPTRQDLRDCRGAILRASGVGFFLGLLPGFSPAVTTFLAYDLERRVSPNAARFGKGAIEGVAAAEGANNAASSGSFVPLFAFGIPSCAPIAVLMGAFMMYGLQPGPRLLTEQPALVWTIIASMYVGNVMLLVLNLPLVGVWAQVARIPFRILGPVIVVSSVVGAYSLRFQTFDVWVALLFGVVGYVLRKTGVPVAPLVLASVLVETLETSLRLSLILSNGSPYIFFRRPISAVIMVAALILFARSVWTRRSQPARGTLDEG
jgi:putative tricarboxylic transport membrane protein